MFSHSFFGKIMVAAPAAHATMTWISDGLLIGGEQMKKLILFLLFLAAATVLPAQQPLSPDEALQQLYHQYDAGKGTAQWLCTKKQHGEITHEGWPCQKEPATVSVSVELMAEVQEGGAEKLYLVSSAKPESDQDNYECHACAPAIGIAVFVWQAQHWVIESANPAVEFYGGWGSPPQIELVQIGPEKHGFLLSDGDDGGGFAESYKILLAPQAKSVSELWRIQDEQDDEGAYDSTDRLATHLLYRSSAAFRFYATHQDNGSLADYYEIEVISRGASSKDLVHSKPENWTETYRFSDGKYKLIHHRDFIEVRKPKSKNSRPIQK
jgi:hypothetical protein